MNVIGWGNFLVVVSAMLATGSVALYALHPRSRKRWYHDTVGRHLMAYMGAIALVLDLLAVRAVAGAALDTRWFTIVRLCSFSLVPIVLGWRLAIIVLVLYEGKTHDDSHLPDSHVDNVDQ